MNCRFLSIALAVNAAVAAMATDAAQAADTTGPVASGIEEIIVTARRREENLQETPVSVTALSAQELQRQSIKELYDLTLAVPGINFAGSGGPVNTVISIRGMSRAVVGNVQPAATPYVNEVPLDSWGANIPTYDIGSVQVFKGPQGTLFGRNSTTGALLVTTAKPTHEFEGYGQVTVGSHRWNTYEGAINLPLNDMFSLRVAGLFDRRDGYTKNLSFPSKKLDDRHRDNVRVSLLFEPTKDFSNLTIYENNQTDEVGNAVIPYASTGPSAAINAVCGASVFPGLGGFAPYCNITRFIGPVDQVTTSIANRYSRVALESLVNTTTWNLGGVTLKNIFGHRETYINQSNDVDGTLLPMIDAVLSSHNQKQVSDELQASGTAFNDDLSYIAGLFYVDSRPNGAAGLYLQAFKPVGTPATAPLPAGASGNSDYYHDTSHAIYGQINYKLGGLSKALDAFSVDFGMRHTHDHESVCTVAFQQFGVPTVPPGACTGAAFSSSSSADFSKSTYTVGLNYKPTNNLLIYAVTRSGYRSGGLNTPHLGGTLSPFQSWKPEEIKDIELGVKSDATLAGMPIRSNVALFQSKVKDLIAGLTTGSSPNPDGDNNPANNPSNNTFYENVGTATIKGVELDLTLLPTDDLELSFGGAWLSKRIDQLSAVVPPSLAGFTFPTKAFVGSLAFLGSPDYSVNAGLNYKLPMSSDMGKLTFSTRYFYQGHTGFGSVEMKSGQAKQLNLRLDWKGIMRSNFDGALFVTNAGDNRHPIGAVNSNEGLGINSAPFNEPRMVGVQVRYNFGR